MAFAFVVTMVGTTLPTPLYPLYALRYGFGSLTMTVIYAVYAVGVLGSLVGLGHLSDHIGRRRILLAALALSALSALAFLAAGGLAALLVGRVLSGLSAGLVTGTATIALVELAPPRRHATAALVAAVANLGGLGLGPILAGTLAQYAPAPTVLCFLVDLVLLALAAGGVWLTPETVETLSRPSLRWRPPRLSKRDRRMFARAAVAGFAGYCMLGLFTSVSPLILADILHRSNVALTGLVTFAVFAASAVGQICARLVSHRRALALGCGLLAVGLSSVALSLPRASLVLLTTGGMVAGLGQGMSFRAGLETVTAASSPGQRANVISSYFVVLYVAISLPVVGLGVATQRFDLTVVGAAFACGVAVLGLLAMFSVIRRPVEQVKVRGRPEPSWRNGCRHVDHSSR